MNGNEEAANSTPPTPARGRTVIHIYIYMRKNNRGRPEETKPVATRKRRGKRNMTCGIRDDGRNGNNALTCGGLTKKALHLLAGG